MRNLVPAVALVLALVFSGSARAHKVIASVYAEGDVVEGEIGFSNGDMAPADTLVEVFDAAGAKIGESRTDKDGLFRYKPSGRLALTFRADLGGGHVAETTMSADELPGGAGGAAASGTEAEASDAPSAVSASAVPSSAILRAMIAEAVRDEVKPLRREIAAYKEKNDLQSILGGIGYIVGMFGIGYYLVARRKLRQA